MERLRRAPVGWFLARFTYDESSRLQAIRFEVVLVDAVIAHERIGEHDDLPRVARVGENLLITGHAGVENDLAEGRSDGSERAAFVDRAVAEN